MYRLEVDHILKVLWIESHILEEDNFLQLAKKSYEV